MLHDLILPHMGESISEATILRWLVNEGDTVTKDQPLVEIATDKVDSEISSPVTGVLKQILFHANSIAPIDSILAIISDSGAEELTVENNNNNNFEDLSLDLKRADESVEVPVPYVPPLAIQQKQEISFTPSANKGDRFYSPLIRTIAREENITKEELDAITGTGPEGRVTKKDLFDYIGKRNLSAHVEAIPLSASALPPLKNERSTLSSSAAPKSDLYEIIEMDRMRRLIADHMVMSKQTSPHVTSFIEADVTRIVNWRNKIKGEFQKLYNQNITYTPIFVDAVVKAIKEYPLINSSLNGYQILQKKNINIGMATALPAGNLIVPVIKNADSYNLKGLTFVINDLATRARENKLKPDEVTEGTFTITNLGSFSSLTGVPIINQPQLAILALGNIQKKPVVLETPEGDTIGIRQIMILSMSYDHRVIDGYMGGMFLKKVKNVLESFDYNTII